MADQQPASKRILIADFDIFGLTGGGQTVYQKIIERRPEVEFFYFIDREELNGKRPPNAKIIPFEPYYIRRPVAGTDAVQQLYDVYIEANNFAFSVAKATPGTSFDVIDTPDYKQVGIFLRLALEHHGISVGTVTLAMHGTISSAIQGNWPGGGNLGRTVELCQFKEHLQFRVVENRYAISENYRDDWRKFYGFSLPVHILDPLSVIEIPDPQLRTDNSARPDLYFVGRREKRKGPDLFIDLIWWLPKDLFGKACLIGGDGKNLAGEGSDRFLIPMARLRDVDIEIVEEMPRDDLLKIFGQRTVTFLPSRYDQFNLIALESLLRGCPTAIGEGAGVVPFLKNRLPSIPFIQFRLSHARGNVDAIQDLLENYDARRVELVEALQKTNPVGDSESLLSLYDEDQAFDRRARNFARDQFTSFALFGELRPRPIARRIFRALPEKTRERIDRAKKAISYRQLRTKFRTYGRNTLLRTFGSNEKCVREFKSIRQSNYFRGQVSWHYPEATGAEIDRKTEFLQSVVESRYVDRIRLFRELARLERIRGNDLLSATYSLRILRWLGRDHFGDLASTTYTLRRFGYEREAQAAHAMFDDETLAFDRGKALLNNYFEGNLRKKNVSAFEFVDDRRPARSYKAAVIVSLYKAEDNLSPFIQMLQQQTLVRKGLAEVIFIDSGSPTNEYQIFLDAIEITPLPAVYARSHKRETIQAAWNRGIALSRADYLAFLGADEGIHPRCLEILSAELDDHPDIDWVMSGSIVTSVNEDGIFDGDIMPYDRTGYRHEWHYLDCTFLSYVGGLYRRSIHDRFGYYDESFRAAGDTEFKNRILPHIRSKYVAQILGVFNNYPEERTTQHPRAEIEDLRAWYLHRTKAGVDYAFPNSDLDRAEALLQDTLRYRKCYCAHASSDIDLALSLSEHLAERSDDSRFGTIREDLLRLVKSYRQLELLPAKRRGRVNQGQFLRTWRKAKGLERKHEALLGVAPAYEIFNDNRYEQHWWPWRSK